MLRKQVALLRNREMSDQVRNVDASRPLSLLLTHFGFSVSPQRTQ